jgi:hypothetical protein
MAQYTTSSGPLTSSRTSFQTRPAKIRRLSSSAYIQATEGVDDVVLEAGRSLLALASQTATHTDQIEALDSAVAGLEASMQTKVEEETFDAAVSSLQAAVALKAAQSDLDATNALVATKAAQSDLAATQRQTGPCRARSIQRTWPWRRSRWKWRASRTC